MTNTAELEQDQPLQWVTLTLDNETYGINVMQVQEVLRVPEIAPVPGAPDYVLGIINLRGNVVTVIDTRKRFGLPSREMDEDAQKGVAAHELASTCGLTQGEADLLHMMHSKIGASVQ